jgi:hypothetical protein
VKLWRTSDDGVGLRLTPSERNLLEGILREYPLIPASHHRLSRTAEANQIAADQRLLDEAISAQKTEHQRRWQAALREPGRFRPRGQSHELILKVDEIEWFLQLLNDIRVGSWLKLGCPGPGEDLPPEPTEADLCCCVAMEFCGLLQSLLLRALHPPE